MTAENFHPSTAAPATTLHITGGSRLAGTVRIDSSGTTAQVLIAAAAALMRPVVLEGEANGEKTVGLLKLLDECGWQLERDHTCLTVAPRRTETRPELLESNTAATVGYLIAPALIWRYGYVVLPRPQEGVADTELQECLTVYKEFGDEVAGDAYKHRYGYAITIGTGIRPVDISLPYRSKAATITALIRAAAAGIELRLEHPDTSPATRTLWAALRSAGFTGTFTDDRVHLIPNRARKDVDLWSLPIPGFEAALYMCAMTATGGAGAIAAAPARMQILRDLLRRVGVNTLYDSEHTLHVDRYHAPRTSSWDGIRVRAGMGPAQLDPMYIPLLTVLGLRFEGRHRVADSGDPQQIDHLAAALTCLGADFARVGSKGRELVFTGPQTLHAASVVARDRHIAAALLIAALAAPEGISAIQMSDVLLGTFPHLIENLQGLGAQIEIIR